MRKFELLKDDLIEYYEQDIDFIKFNEIYKKVINNAMIAAYNKAIDDCCRLLLDAKCQTLIKPKDFKF